MMVASDSPEWLAQEISYQINILEQVLRNPKATAIEREIASTQLTFMRQVADAHRRLHAV